MKRISLFIIALLFISCQTLPVINSTLLPADEKNLICPSPFLKEKTQLVHSIETSLQGDTQSVIIGITVADPATRFISSALMTSEGIVLLEVQSAAGQLKVDRALPPFDSGDFAKKMIDDIDLIFFAPQGVMQKRGKLADGSIVCRWHIPNGDWVDLIAAGPGTVEIKKYLSCGSLKRHVKIQEKSGNAYQIVELQANEMVSFALLMTLIDAKPYRVELPVKERSKGLK